MVERGLAATRARARDLVLRGEVSVAGRNATKPAQPVTAADDIVLTGGPADYVSRGALKLRHALAHFGLDAQGRAGLDIGASTGGFTEVLLASGARRVYAVENGHGQLHPRLAHDPRVVSLEGVDARSLSAAIVAEPIGAIVADVSFIALSKALPAALALAHSGCWLTALVKPQFEAGRDRVPRKGVVRDPDVQAAVVTEVAAWLEEQEGWRVVGTTASPIQGGDGNVEFLMAAVLEGPCATADPDNRPAAKLRGAP